MIDKPCCIMVSMEEYQRDIFTPVPSLSRSDIKQLLYQSPAHAFYNHPRLNPDWKPGEKEERFDIGTAAHSMFLEGIDVAMEIEADDWRKKETKEAREEARAAGRIPLLSKQYEEVMAMVNEAHKALHNSELNCNIWNGMPEQSYFWREGGVWCKCRVDWINTEKTVILDYKTTGKSANPEDFSGIVISTGLDIQDAFYRRGVHMVDGTDPDFIFMVQETSPPYPCSFLRLDMMFQDMGLEKVRKGMKIWKDCLSTGKWPGYPSSIYTLEPPAWALASWEMRKGAYDVHI